MLFRRSVIGNSYVLIFDPLSLKRSTPVLRKLLMKGQHKGKTVMQWEYQTIFVQAEARLEEAFLQELRDWKEGIPLHTPEAMIPRLNSYGEQGWELVHMQPVGIGSKGDILMQDGSGSRFWSYTYFCVFKRPRE